MVRRAYYIFEGSLAFGSSKHFNGTSVSKEHNNACFKLRSFVFQIITTYQQVAYIMLTRTGEVESTYPANQNSAAPNMDTTTMFRATRTIRIDAYPNSFVHFLIWYPVLNRY